jgi:hypothetical protein
MVVINKDASLFVCKVNRGAKKPDPRNPIRVIGSQAGAKRL